MKMNKKQLFAAIGSLSMAGMLAVTSIAQPPEGDAPREGRRPGGRADGDAGRPENGERPEDGRAEGDRRDGERRDGERPDGGRRASGRPDGGRPDGAFGGRDGMRGGDPKMSARMMMERFDKDGDKKLNSEELVAALSEMRPPGGPEGANGGPGGPGGAAWADNMFKQNDKDGDGKLTGDEIPERMRQGMARVDTNNDGSVDRAEVERMMKNFGGGAGGGRPPRDGQPGEGGDRPARRPAVEE